MFELSNPVLTENKIRILDKGLRFVPTPEKIDRYQIKMILSLRDIKLKMYYETEPTPAFKLYCSYSSCLTGVIS